MKYKEVGIYLTKSLCLILAGTSEQLKLTMKWDNLQSRELSVIQIKAAFQLYLKKVKY